MVWGKKTREEYEKEENNLNMRMPLMQIFDGVTLMKSHVILKSDSMCRRDGGRAPKDSLYG